MTMLKRVLKGGLIGAGIGVIAQAGYLLCYFNETLARLFLIPLLYAGFWPVLLVDALGRRSQAGPEGHPLGVSCLISIAGWSLLGVAWAAGRALWTRCSARAGAGPAPTDEI
jgi:hypothetical protein